MKKFEGILICTDLDGTLLRGDKSISRENKEAIEYFKAEGGKFTFVTGRMPYFSQKAREMVKPNAPIGCGNGGGLYGGEPADGEYSGGYGCKGRDQRDETARLHPDPDGSASVQYPNEKS